ncbi:peptidase S8/S53 domain-containing protein [Catenaria anguillulae PL171]|uniref:Peptidase S8/S53 domain-containing protein n=1 Tax=Catenaria anguillulae PL171 TaxID=765915 RepID=A0A1Y2HZH5_9FUNG|nr:peptidase S8/S53 domain-containing protein [Catenaria anguillulae PL171]
MHTPATISLLVLAATLALAQSSPNAPPAEAQVPNSYLITFKSNVPDSSASLQSLRATIDRENARESTTDGGIQSSIDSASYASIGSTFRAVPATLSTSTLEQIRRHPSVASVVPNLKYQISAPAPAPAAAAPITQQAPVPNWGLARIVSRTLPADLKSSPYAYPSSAGSGVNVYVLDTGIHMAHQDIRGRVDRGVATCSGCKVGTDPQGHGSHVCGIAIGTLHGVAKRARCTSVTALDAQGFGTTADMVKALDWIVKTAKSKPNERAVVNMSIHGYEDRALNAAVDAAVAEGIPVVVAAGNKGQAACYGSPSSARSAIVVGATDSRDWMATWSNYGSCVTLLAPGVDILSIKTGTTAGTATMSGTSMASPMVAGVVALMLSQDPTLTPQQIRDRLWESATDGVLNDTVYGTPNKLVFVGTQ